MKHDVFIKELITRGAFKPKINVYIGEDVAIISEKRNLL